MRSMLHRTVPFLMESYGRVGKPAMSLLHQLGLRDVS
jgi:hypothetical protein